MISDNNRLYIIYHGKASMVGIALVLRDWEEYSSQLKGSLRDRAYWGAVEAVLFYGKETLDVIATRRGWTPTEVARRIVENRAKWY